MNAFVREVATDLYAAAARIDENSVPPALALREPERQLTPRRLLIDDVPVFTFDEYRARDVTGEGSVFDSSLPVVQSAVLDGEAQALLRV